MKDILVVVITAIIVNLFNLLTEMVAGRIYDSIVDDTEDRSKAYRRLTRFSFGVVFSILAGHIGISKMRSFVVETVI